MNGKRVFAVVAGTAALTGAAFAFYRLQDVPSPIGNAANEYSISSFDHFKFNLHDRPKRTAALSFADEAGNRHTLADFRGKLILLNLWATWCPPCREEMPSLARLQAKLGGSDFTVVALSIDAGESALSKVRQFYQETGIKNLPIYIDSAGMAANDLGAVGLPTTLLLDRDGQEIGRTVGPANWDGPEVAALVRTQLDGVAGLEKR
jgi:thiol-disulfide isomerase/thioredoxin